MTSKLNRSCSQREFDCLVKDKKLKLARLSKAYSTSDLTKVRRDSFASVINKVKLSRSFVDLTSKSATCLTSKSDSNINKGLTISSIDQLTESFRNRTEHPAKVKTLERITKNIEKDRNSESVKQRDSNSAAKKRWQGSMQHTLSSQAKTKEAKIMAEKRQQTKKSRSTRLPPIETPGRPNRSARPAAQPNPAATTKVKSRAFSAPKPREVSATNPRSKQNKADKRNFESSVCETCRLQITEKLKRGYNKYKILEKPKQCEKCENFTIDYDFYQICWECAKNAGVCAKCASGSTKISGAKFFQVVKSGMEQNMLSMNSHQLKKFAEKHAKVHALEDILSPIIAQSEASWSRTSSAASSRSSSARTSPCNSRASSARSRTSPCNSRVSSARNTLSDNRSTSPTASSAKSDMARTMTSSSSPVRETDTTYASTDDVYNSDEAYGSGVISAVGSEDHRSGKLTQQVSHEELFPKTNTSTLTEESDILNKIRSLTNLDIRSPTMAKSVLREIRSLTDINYNPDHHTEVNNTYDPFTYSRHDTPYSEHDHSPRPKSIVYDNDIQPNIRSGTSTSCSVSRQGSTGTPKLVPLDNHPKSPVSTSSPLPPIPSPIIRGSSEHQEMISDPSTPDDEITEDRKSITPKTETEEVEYLDEEFEESELTVLFDDEKNKYFQDLEVTKTSKSATSSTSEKILNVIRTENDVIEVKEELQVTEEVPGSSNAGETPKLDDGIDDFIEDVVDADDNDIFGGTENSYIAEEPLLPATLSFSPLAHPKDTESREELPESPKTPYGHGAIGIRSDLHKEAYENGLEIYPENRNIYEDSMEFLRTKEEIGTFDESLIAEIVDEAKPDQNEELYNYSLYARSDPNLDQTESFSNTTVETDPEIENFQSSYDNTDINIMSIYDADINMMSMQSTGDSEVFESTFESTFESDYTITDDSQVDERVDNSELIHRVPHTSPTAEEWEEYQQQIEIARQECGLSGPYEILEVNLHKGSDYPEMEFLENICYEYRGYPMRCKLADIPEEGTLSKETTCVTCTTHQSTESTHDLEASSSSDMLVTLQTLTATSETIVPAIPEKLLNSSETLELSYSDPTEGSTPFTELYKPLSLEEETTYSCLDEAVKGVVMNALIGACIEYEGEVIGQRCGL